MLIIYKPFAGQLFSKHGQMGKPPLTAFGELMKAAGAFYDSFF
jgi:hypothetical protein